MKKIVLAIICLITLQQTNAQILFRIFADTVLISKRDSTPAELKLQNATKNVNGFLFNTGNGITQFKRPISLDDTTFVIGIDTFRIKVKTHAPGGGSMGYPGAGIPFSTGSAWESSLDTTRNFLDADSLSDVKIPTSKSVNDFVRNLIRNAAGNGLTFSANKFNLGGTLNNDVTFTGAGNQFYFNDMRGWYGESLTGGTFEWYSRDGSPSGGIQSAYNYFNVNTSRSGGHFSNLAIKPYNGGAPSSALLDFTLSRSGGETLNLQGWADSLQSNKIFNYTTEDTTLYNSRTLVTKNYVNQRLSGISGSSYTAGNGIKITGNTIRWADTLFNNTYLHLPTTKQYVLSADQPTTMYMGFNSGSSAGYESNYFVINNNVSSPFLKFLSDNSTTSGGNSFSLFEVNPRNIYSETRYLTQSSIINSRILSRTLSSIDIKNEHLRGGFTYRKAGALFNNDTVSAKSYIYGDEIYFKTGITPYTASYTLTNTDTTANKPLVINTSTGLISRMTSWPGGGGDTTSLSNRINLKLNISDTSAMLSPYLQKIDTTGKWISQGWLSTLNENIGNTNLTLTGNRTLGTGGFTFSKLNGSNFLQHTFADGRQWFGNSATVADSGRQFQFQGNMAIGTVRSTNSTSTKLNISISPGQNQGLVLFPEGMPVNGTFFFNAILQTNSGSSNERNMVHQKLGNDAGGVSSIHIKDRTVASNFGLNTANLNPVAGDIIGRYSFFARVYPNATTSGTLREYSRFESIMEGVNAATVQGSARLAFFTNNFGSLTEQMRITPTGAVLIGTTVTDSSALLNLTSTTQGFLPPRLTGVQMAAVVTPSNGLQIYNTDSLAPVYYNGSAWVKIGAGGGGIPADSSLLYSNRDLNNFKISDTASKTWSWLDITGAPAFITNIPGDSSTSINNRINLKLNTGLAFLLSDTAAKTWSWLDITGAPAFITQNQSITFAPTGDVTGSASGSTSLTPAFTITNNAVTGEKIQMGGDVHGDLLYYDGTNYVRLPAGTSGNVLQTNGTGANPTWVTPGAGSFSIPKTRALQIRKF